MADNYWQPIGASTDGNAAANWSLGRVPTTGDTATFVGDDGGHPEWENACTFTSGLTCDGFDAQATYSGAINLGSGLTYTIGSVGLTFAHTGNLTIASTLSISNGPLTWSACTGTITTTSCSLTVVSGTCIFLPLSGSGSGRSLLNVTVASGATLQIGTAGAARNAIGLGLLDLTGTLSILNAGSQFQINGPTAGDAKIRTGGVISGSGTFSLLTFKSGGGLTEMNGTINVAKMSIVGAATSPVIVPCTIGSTTTTFAIIYANSVIKPNAGTLTISGNLIVNYGSSGTNGKLDLTNGCTLVVTGNLVLDNDLATDYTITAAASTGQIRVYGDITNTGAGAGSWVWTPGTLPLLYFTGIVAQAAVIPGGTPSVEINKSADTLTFSAAMTLAGITRTTGAVDFGAGAVTCSTISLLGAGNVTLSSGGTTASGSVSINTTGVVTAGGALSCSSWTLTAGTFDPNVQTITTTGNCTVVAGANFLADADAFNGCTWTIGGNLDWRGQRSSHLLLNGTADWTLNVTGTTYAKFVTVSHSLATGTAVAALGSTDGGDNNVKWTFPSGGVGGGGMLLRGVG